MKFNILIFLPSSVLLTLSLFVYINSMNLKLCKEKDSADFKTKCLKISYDILNDFKTDDCNSKFSELYLWNDKIIENLKINLISESDKLNITSFPKNIVSELCDIDFLDTYNNFETPRLKFQLEKDFQNYKNSCPSELDYTFYGFRNINLVGYDYLYEILDLKKLNIMENEKLKLKEIKTYAELKKLNSLNYDVLFPLYNLESCININFVSEEFFRKFINLKFFNIKNSEQKIHKICEVRNLKEIDDENLKNILALNKNHVLYKFLGCKTWFWKIEINDLENSKNCFNLIFCIIPEDEDFSSGYKKLKNKELRILKIE